MADTPCLSDRTPPHDEIPMHSDDDLQLLTTAVNDLQTNRLTALRLYQDEKSLRQQDCTRVSQLTVQLNSLQQQLTQKNNAIQRLQSQAKPVSQEPRPQQKQYGPSPFSSNRVLQTSRFWADVHRVDNLPPLVPPSLTWYSPCMYDQLVPCDHVIAHLNSLRELEGPSAQGTSPESDEPSDSSTRSNSIEPEILKLQLKLKESEDKHNITKKELAKTQQLVVQLKEQIGTCKQTVKDLADAIKQQESVLKMNF